MALAAGIVAHAPQPVPDLDDHRVIERQILSEFGSELVKYGIVGSPEPFVWVSAAHVSR
jgi:hypothetical protein